MIHKISFLFVTLLAAVSSNVLMPCGCDADVLATPIIYAGGKLESRFHQRIAHLKEQVEKGQQKGWLSADQATKFSGEYERVANLEKQWESNGFPATDVNVLEKEVNTVHHLLHTAMNEGVHKLEQAAKTEAKTDATSPVSTTNHRHRRRSNGIMP